MNPLTLGEPAAILAIFRWDWWNLVFVAIVLGLLIAAFYFRGKETSAARAAGAATSQPGKGSRTRK